MSMFKRNRPGGFTGDLEKDLESARKDQENQEKAEERQNYRRQLLQSAQAGNNTLPASTYSYDPEHRPKMTGNLDEDLAAAKKFVAGDVDRWNGRADEMNRSLSAGTAPKEQGVSFYREMMERTVNADPTAFARAKKGYQTATEQNRKEWQDRVNLMKSALPTLDGGSTGYTSSPEGLARLQGRMADTALQRQQQAEEFYEQMARSAMKTGDVELYNRAVEGMRSELGAASGVYKAYAGAMDRLDLDNAGEDPKQLEQSYQTASEAAQRALAAGDEEGYRKFSGIMEQSADALADTGNLRHAIEIESSKRNGFKERGEEDSYLLARDEKANQLLKEPAFNGEVNSVDSLAAFYAKSYSPSEIEQMQREMRERKRSLRPGAGADYASREYENALLALVKAKELKRKSGTLYEEIVKDVMNQDDFDINDNRRPESLRNRMREDDVLRAEYYSLDKTARRVFIYLWKKDEETDDQLSGREEEYVRRGEGVLYYPNQRAWEFIESVPGIKEAAQQKAAEDQYVPNDTDSFWSGAEKVLGYILDNLNAGGETALVSGLDALEGRTTTGHARNEEDLSRAMAASGTFYRSLGGAAQSVGRMLPAMAVGNIAGAAAAASPAAIASLGELTKGAFTAAKFARDAQNAAFFLTTKGSAKQEAIEKYGMTEEQAESYSILSAASEVWLQNAIGGIAQFGGISETQLGSKVDLIKNSLLRTAAHVGVNIAGEVTEEETQNFLEPLFVSILTGDKYQAPTGQELLETFLSTAMMVGATNAGDTISYYNESKIRSNLVKMSELCQKMGGEYKLVADQINEWVAKVDSSEDLRYEKSDMLSAFDLMGMAELKMREAGIDMEQVADEIQEKADTERKDTKEPAGETREAAEQSEKPGREKGELPSIALESVEEQARKAALKDGAGMSRTEIRETIESYEAMIEENRDNDEFLAQAKGQIRGLQEALNEKQLAAGDDLGLAEGLGRIGVETEKTDASAAPQNDRTGENGGRQTAVTTAEQEVMNNGTGTEGAADSGQRDAGLGTGEQAGSLGEGAGSAAVRNGERGGSRKAELAQLKNYVQALGAKRQSAREIGIRNGTKNAANLLIEDEGLTDSMRQLRSEAEAAGLRVDFVLGKMETRSKTGRVQSSSGIFQFDKDGTPHAFIQADSRLYSPQQLFDHELFHSIVAANKGLWQEMVDHLYATHTQEEIAAMVDAYVSAYDGCYGVEAGSEDLYLEEIFADVYAEMKRGGGQQSAARDLAGETVQRFAGDIENARQNRAGIDRTNGPGTRLSIEADTELEEKNITDGKAAVRSLIEQAKTSNNPEDLSVENAMYRSDIGYIDLKWGTPGRGEKFKRGYGLAHIIAKRNAEGGNGEAVAYKLIEVIAKATDGDQQTNDQTSPGNERIRLYYDGYTAVLVKSQGANKWLLTGWQNNETEASAVGEVRDSSNATTVTPIRTRRNGDATVSIDSIAQGKGKSNSNPAKSFDENSVDWNGNREALPAEKESYKWSELRDRVADMTESQRKSLVAEAAELNESTWREGGLGIKPYSGDLADTEAVLKYVDDAVDAVRAESIDYEPSFEIGALPAEKESYKWSEIRDRVADMNELQRRNLVDDAAELNEATWREEGLGIKPYSGDLADTEAVLKYVDDAVDAVRAESIDYEPSFEIEALPANKESGTRLSAADEEDDSLSVDWFGNREEDEIAAPEAPARNDRTGETDSSATPQNNNERAEDAGSSAATRTTEEKGFEGLAREKKVELAERVGIDGLKSRIKTAEERLKMWKAMQSSGLVAQDAKSVQELKNRIADAKETIDIFKKELAKKQAAKKAAASDKALKAERKQRRAAEKKALAKEAELKDNTPRQARREFREDALNLFSVQAGKRQTLGNIINSFADKMIAQGSVSETDRAELFRQLYEAGVEVVQADEYHRNIRQTVDNARIYVPDSVREEFGDDWSDFRQRAWGNGVYLTNSQNDRDADSWNAELAELFPGSFDAEETDARNMLENIVDLAEEGKAEFVSLPEMMRRNQAETGVTVDQQMDELERKVDHMIDTFAQKADLEIRTKKQGMMQLVKERQRNREMAARQVQRQRENDTRNQVMKQLQQLNKMRKRTAPEIQKQIDSIIGNLDTMARSISPEGMENLQALSRKYSEAAQDPNFLGNPYVEARLARLSQTQLDSLEISDVIELGRTISALVKTVTEDKRLLTDAREREISDAAMTVNREIASSAGSKGGKLREFFGNEHLSPTRELQRLGGWVRDGMMEQLSRALEDGGTKRMNYQRQATRIFDKFLEDKANQKWLEKAQGKNAEWISVTVPTRLTDEGGHVHFENQTVEITPMMRVALLMHSQNVDNLRHIETGGIVIPNKEYYSKGDLANADAKGTRVKMRPEVVRAIVKDCTAQERAFAGLLEQYYDGLSKEKINEVSMLIDGFERAGGDHYYGIKVSRKFLATLPEQVQKNMSLESIGSIVNERIHAGNPIILEDASKALEDHIDLISKYYGYTAAIRDFNAVMNYTFHEGLGSDGEVNAYAGSIKETLQDKWGAGAQKYIDDLLGDLQQSSGINETAAAFLSKLRGNLAGASLMFNPAVALSQTASLPGAMQTLGIDGVVASLKPEKVDMNLVEKYSPILWYRNQGNSTQELGDYMKEKGLEGKLPFFFNWIQKMDSWTIRRLWAGAEYRVSKDTDLAPGSKAQIDAGEDAYYQEVARVFQRAVYDTQPNYSEMQRPAILRSKSDLTKMLTMYKTVPLQYYNMMYEAVGRLKADKARFAADGSEASKAQLEQSRRFAVKTFAGVLGANVVYVAMKAAIKGLLGGKDKKYKDEEGKLDPGIIGENLGKDLVETYAGSVIFGAELLTGMEKLYSAATTGKYSMYGGLEISALGAVEDTLGGIYNLAKELYKEDLTGGLGAVKDLAKQIAMDTGIPANNIETYLLGTAKWFAPEWVDRYENFFDEFERADLKGEHGRDLRAAIRVLMDNRTDGLKDETIDELMRLWETGQNAVIPSAIPSKVTVDGEDVEIKGADKATFRERWGQVVNNSLEQLLSSDAYQAADDAGKAKLISKLYEYARQQAAADVTNKNVDAWVEFGKACEAAGIPLEQYLAVASVDKSKLKDMDGEALDNAIQARMEFRAGELNEKTLDELARLYAAGETSAVPSDVPTSVSVSGEENKLTAEERVAWLQAWKRTAGENLEALMASKAYAETDDAGKAKLISTVYDLARASASSDVVSGYSPDKWITVGMEASERGVPLDEYAAFHVGLSKLKTAEKMDLLKSQKWTEEQKDFLWSKLMASDSQLAKYENLKNAGMKWSDAMERLGIGEATASSSGLTDEQQAQYDKYFSDISGPATQRLLNNTTFRRGDKATQAAYLDRLNDYAARSAKAKVLSGYDKGKWVECGERLTSAGVKLDDYIVYYEGISDAKNRDKYAALAATSWTDSQKLIALEYISASTCSAARVGKNYELSMNLYLEGLAKADSDQSGNISQAEAEAYLDGLGNSVGWEEKAYLWQMLSIQSKWKNNPYSAKFGEEIWYSLHPEG